MSNVKEIQGYKCESCGALIPEDEVLDSPLYECECGTTFNRDNSYDGGSHQCPECRKFSSKVADLSCPECEQGPVEETTYYEDEDNEKFEDKPTEEDVMARVSKKAEAEKRRAEHDRREKMFKEMTERVTMYDVVMIQDSRRSGTTLQMGFKTEEAAKAFAETLLGAKDCYRPYDRYELFPDSITVYKDTKEEAFVFDQRMKDLIGEE